MKLISSKTSKKKITIIVAAAIVLAIGVYGTTAYATKGLWPFIESSNNSTSSGTTTQSDATTSESSSSSSESQGAANKTDSTNSDPQATTSVDNTSGKTVVSVVTSVDISSNVVYIRGGINNAVDMNGSCYALLTGPDGSTTRKDTTLMQNPSTVDCKTIQISAGSLAKGAWTYTLNYSSTNYEGTSSEGTFTIQ